jgi:hypothetical protein
MATKTHLGYQEEGILETGLQIRIDDPITPVENQCWLNTTEQRLKLRKSGITLILIEGIGEAIEIPPSTICDLLDARSFFKTVSNNYSLEFASFNSGMTASIRIDNTSPDQAQITNLVFPSAANIDDGDHFIIYSASNLIKYYVWFDLDGLDIADPNVSGATGVKVPFTKGLPEISELTCPAASSITSGQYFLINAGGDATEYYVWFNKDGAGGDPLVVGKTGIQVAIISADTSSDVATKLASALDALAAFISSASTNIVTVTTATNFGTTDATNVSVGGIFAIAIAQQGVQLDSAVSIAQKVRAELNPLAAFSAPNPVTPTLVVTNEASGFTSNPEIGTMNVGFSFSVVTSGSGPIFVTFPSEVSLDENTDAFIPALSTKLFFCIKIGNDIFVNGRVF